jgi:predicted adenylyl cyclase CyaB
MIEQEVKLAFESVEAARLAITTAGGRLVVSRRLIDDRLYDTTDRALGRADTTCRLRREPDQAFLTFKGPTIPGPVTMREENETRVIDADAMERILAGLGLTPVFRAQKYREEYDLDDASVTVDETPVGAFVEIEATAAVIERVARRLHKAPSDYRLESYPRIYLAWCAANGRPPGDMLFD